MKEFDSSTTPIETLGYATPQANAPKRPRTDLLCVASLLLGIFALPMTIVSGLILEQHDPQQFERNMPYLWVSLAFLLLIGAVLGILGRRRVLRSDGMFKGDTLALVGISLCLGLLGFFTVVILLMR